MWKATHPDMKRKQRRKQLITARTVKTVLKQPAHTRQTKVAFENRINFRLAYSSFEDKCDVCYLRCNKTFAHADKLPIIKTHLRQVSSLFTICVYFNST